MLLFDKAIFNIFNEKDPGDISDFDVEKFLHVPWPVPL